MKNPLPLTRPLCAITAYDYAFASMAQESGLDFILVGDSMANVMLGLSHTKDIQAETMYPWVAAVARGAPQTHLVADMPLSSTQSAQRALQVAQSFLAAGADAVKVEGYQPEIIQTLLRAQIPVMGHMGLLPQTAKSFKQVNYSEEQERQLLAEILELQGYGMYALVLEHIPQALAQRITTQIQIPTIGIGAGPYTSGQILVLHDVLGLSQGKPPSFSQAFAQLRSAGIQGMTAYRMAVKDHDFPRKSL